MNPPDFATIESFYLLEHNCLLLRADFEPVFIDYYLHFGELGFQFEGEEDTLLKDLLAATALHAVSRPRAERLAWTLHLPDWPRNFFVSASNPEEELTGRVFREQVAEDDHASLISQQQSGYEPARTSVVALENQPENALKSAEEFYQRSEQRPARLCRAEADEYLMLVGMPGSDPAWVEAQTDENIRQLAEEIQAQAQKPLETRRFFFRCACNIERIFPAIEPMLRADFEGFFGEDEALQITCPRCARKFALTREQAEALIQA